MNTHISGMSVIPTGPGEGHEDQRTKSKEFPGASGVLLNRSHPLHDLVLAIDAKERRIFDAIDGQRSLAQIMNHVNAQCSADARTFFEKLWRYDQVVFDTSNSGSPS